MYRRQPEVPRSTSPFSKRTAACAVVGVVGLLGAARPVGDLYAGGAAGSFKYDIKTTVTTVKTGTGQSTRAYDEGLAHAQVANGKARIDVAKGPIGGVFDTPEFLIIHDSTTLLFDPGHMQYAQVDPLKMMQGVGGVMGGVNAMVGIQAANVKIVEESLGLGDQLGPNATVKYRITEDYTINLNLMGMASSMTGHTSTDYWYPKSAMALINPFVPKGAATSTPVSLGADYAAQMTAAQSKLPVAVPLKTVSNKVIADANGNRTTTTTTWELLSIVAAPVPDATFATPTGYTQMTGADMMAVATGGAASGTTTAGATGAATTGAATTGTGSTTAGKTGSGGVGTAAAGAATGVAAGAANSAAQGAQSEVNQAASDAAANTVKKILHLP